MSNLSKSFCNVQFKSLDGVIFLREQKKISKSTRTQKAGVKEIKKENWRETKKERERERERERDRERFQK